MKAVYCERPGGVDVLTDGELDIPMPGPRDVLVAVQAISVNPIDIKQRVIGSMPNEPGPTSPFPDAPKILGYDASGVVLAVGAEVTHFSSGDEIYCMGAVHRAGSNAEYFLVDERQAARKPSRLTHSQAAALPLTGLTAWELLFGGMRVPRAYAHQRGGNQVLLIINGAGGVGSIMIQLAAQLTELTIVATASRPESINWCRSLGAHHVISHHEPLIEGLKALGFSEANYVASLTGTETNMPEIAQLIAPHGTVGIIDAPAALDIVPLKSKGASVAWEGVFIRSLMQTADWISQREVLGKIAELVDADRLESTMTKEMGPICAENLAKAHTLVASGQAIGKIVMTGFC
ncbi:zinc-binding alcohol dehydrogenase family protein [Sphingobium sp. SA916]|uniref:zinc-binding alcohol dehydrogenase family protein n=1 Tax=Sphingobium sp. SA916 TaxID=1851207 RepID=UPI000C9ED76C|nr:zinc-binding alcohol dehydrogenase family protein [Sphingobium sp. SA916]PNQ03959.1 hypothetical protein A8G00_08680 [Sphingobium sp. SA916]